MIMQSSNNQAANMDLQNILLNTKQFSDAKHTLFLHNHASPLGELVSLSDEQQLYLLEFHDQSTLLAAMIKLQQSLKANVIIGETIITHSLQHELTAYFNGQLKVFKTPCGFVGTDFQKISWLKLLEIPYGQTHSYQKQAFHIGNIKAVRAVAKANSLNRLAIIVPCHRVINSNGKLGGYNGGLDRKQWLLTHEAKYFNA